MRFLLRPGWIALTLAVLLVPMFVWYDRAYAGASQRTRQRLA